jgi:hypothetical protein
MPSSACLSSRTMARCSTRANTRINSCVQTAVQTREPGMADRRAIADVDALATCVDVARANAQLAGHDLVLVVVRHVEDWSHAEIGAESRFLRQTRTGSGFTEPPRDCERCWKDDARGHARPSSRS